MVCGRCGLSVRLRYARLTLDRCPRCYAYAGVSVPLENGGLSLLPGGALGDATTPRADDPATPRADDPATPPAEDFGHLVVSVEHSGDRASMTLHGALDDASAHCFERALHRVWATGCPETVLDLSELESIDASGVNALLRARGHALARGNRLVLIPGPPRVQRMFRLTGTLALFTFGT